MFKPSLCRYSTRLEVTLGILMQKINAGKRSLSFFGSKMWLKINHNIKNLKATTTFMYALKKDIFSSQRQLVINNNNFCQIVIKS